MFKQTVRSLALATAFGLSLGYAAPAMAADSDLATLQAKLPGTLVNDPRTLVSVYDPESRATTKVLRKADIPGGGAAAQVIVTKPGPNPWTITAGTPLTGTVHLGDVVTVGFFARTGTGKPDPAHLTVTIQQSAAPWSACLAKQVDIGPNWQWVEASGVATTSILGGQGTINLQLGDRAQTVEIGELIAITGAASIAHPAGAPAIELPKVLADAGGTVINHPEAGPWNFYATGDAVRTDQPDSFVPGHRASRIAVTMAHAQNYEVSVNVPIDAGIAEGDRLLIAFFVRTVAAVSADGHGAVQFRVQGDAPPYDGFADHAVNPGTNWQLIRVNTVATHAIAQGHAGFSLFFGSAQQTLDLGPVYVIKLP